MRGYHALSLETIRQMPAVQVQLLFFEVGRLEARDALLQIQISAYPHWSGSKSDKTAGDRARREFERSLRAQAYGPNRQLDSKGRRVLHNADEFRAWLREWGIEG